MKNYSLYVLIFCFALGSFAQSKRKYIDHGDTAFSKHDYATAIYFYAKYIDKDFFEPKELTYAYDIQKAYLNSDTTLNTLAKRLKSRKQQPKNTSVTLPADTTSSSASKNPPVKDSTEKTEAYTRPEMDEFTRYQYAVHQLAESYRLNYDYENAEAWYQRFLSYSTNTATLDRYWYGVALMRNEKYELASQEFKQFMKDYSDKRAAAYKNKARIHIKSCTFAMSPASTNKKAAVDVIDSTVNFGTSCFGMSYYGDSANFIFAATTRDSSIVSDEKKRYVSGLYTVNKKGNGWDIPQKFNAAINSKDNEGAGVFSKDKTRFYFTQWSSDKKECAIYLSKFFNNEWRPPFKLNEHVNVPGNRSMHPNLTESGVLYFSSDKPGGKGGMDIWFCLLDETGNPAGPATNLEKSINTPEDEVSPFYHDYSAVLYFSSEGHTGLGGFDVFRSFSSIGDNWSEAKNMGRPINSSKDDLYFILQKNQRIGYLTSDRKKCGDCNTGSCLGLYAVKQNPYTFNIKGTVYHAETNEVIPNALITLKDVQYELNPLFVITDDAGNYEKELEEGVEFFVKAQKNKFFADAAAVSTIGLLTSTTFEQDFFLAPIPEGDIVIPGIEYDYDKATLRPASEKILDTLVDFLNLNDNLYVEISSHTDDRGKDDYNVKLSEARAQSVVDYLVSHGIDIGRLMAAGYGESKPLIPNAKTEEEHQKNRRTAFKTVKEDEIKPK